MRSNSRSDSRRGAWGDERRGGGGRDDGPGGVFPPDVGSKSSSIFVGRIPLAASREDIVEVIHNATPSLPFGALVSPFPPCRYLPRIRIRVKEGHGPPTRTKKRKGDEKGTCKA